MEALQKSQVALQNQKQGKGSSIDHTNKADYSIGMEGKGRPGSPTTDVTKLQNVSKAGYAEARQQIDFSDQQLDAAEQKGTSEMNSQKAKLEALQKMKPPTNPDELAQYLMRRLEAAEQSIKV